MRLSGGAALGYLFRETLRFQKVGLSAVHECRCSKTKKKENRQPPEGSAARVCAQVISSVCPNFEGMYTAPLAANLPELLPPLLQVPSPLPSSSKVHGA